MVTLLDHPGLIRRSLVRTQIKIKNSVYCTDVEKWRKFSETYTDDTKEVNLLVSCGTSHISTASSMLRQV